MPDNLPADVALLAAGEKFTIGDRCEDRDALERTLFGLLARMGDGQRVEAIDGEGETYTISFDEMTREECENLPEFDGW